MLLGEDGIFELRASLYNKSGDNYPSQRLTRAEKVRLYGSVEHWCLANVFHLQARSQFNYSLYNRLYSTSDQSDLNERIALNFHDRRRIAFIRNLNLIERGILDNASYISGKNPLSDELLSIPSGVKIEHYDVISKPIRTLIGEQLNRPFNYTISNKNPDVENLLLEETKTLYVQALEELHASFTTPNPMTPDEAVEKAKLNFNSVLQAAEYSANKILTHFVEKSDIAHKFYRSFSQYLCTDHIIFHTNIVNNRPVVRPVNPVFFDCDLPPTESSLEKCSYYVETSYETPAVVVTEFAEYLTEEEIDYIYSNAVSYDTTSQDLDFISYRNSQGRLAQTVMVRRYEWKSFKKIGILNKTQSNGKIIKQFVEESYKPKKSEDVTWRYIPWSYRTVQIGERCFIAMGEIPYQTVDVYNLDRCYSSYTGYIGQYPIVNMLVSYQYLYNVAWWNLKTNIARSAGQVLLFDINQLPSHEEWTLASWLSFLKNYGIALVDSKGTGDDGLPATFREFQSIDLTASNAIQSCIFILEAIKKEIQDIIGITAQRMGLIEPRETARGITQGIVQSSSVTEYLFFNFDQVKTKLLQNIIDLFDEVDLESSEYRNLLDDYIRSYFKANTIMRFKDYGVYVSNSSRDRENLELLRQISAQLFNSQQVKLSTFAEILKTNSLDHIVELTKEMDAKSEQMAQQAQQIEQMKVQAAQQEQELVRYQIDENNKTKIRVAEIHAHARMNDLDQNNDGSIDKQFRDKVNPLE